jgi:hypothetical protein
LFLSKQKNLYDTSSIDLVSWTFEPISSWCWYFGLFQQLFIPLWSWVLDTFGLLFRAASLILVLSPRLIFGWYGANNIISLILKLVYETVTSLVLPHVPCPYQCWAVLRRSG